jgi:hypothetical protein
MQELLGIFLPAKRSPEKENIKKMYTPSIDLKDTKISRGSSPQSKNTNENI